MLERTANTTINNEAHTFWKDFEGAMLSIRYTSAVRDIELVHMEISAARAEKTAATKQTILSERMAQAIVAKAEAKVLFQNLHPERNFI